MLNQLDVGYEEATFNTLKRGRSRGSRHARLNNPSEIAVCARDRVHAKKGSHPIMSFTTVPFTSVSRMARPA